jgi:uncharacterized repeat protein (TIGR03803 family)
MRRLHFVLLSLVLVLGAQPLFATTHYVSPNPLSPPCSNEKGVFFVFCSVTAIAAFAEPATTTFVRLADFNGPDGVNPASLVQGTDGSLYGTTSGGGLGDGTVFKITSAGELITLYYFCSQTNCTDGISPNTGLIQGADGNFYGTTQFGGENNYGTVFKISSIGTLTTLYSFCSASGCTDGGYPIGGLVQAANGAFYGTTTAGGFFSPDQCFSIGCGTFFKITSAGTLTTLYAFCPQTNCTAGTEPNGGLVQDADGNFYGTTVLGGSGGDETCGEGCGTVFKITPEGTLTTLFNFEDYDYGAFPSPLVQGTDGNFYGTTSMGLYGNGCDCGTIFEITPAGTFKTLHIFGSDGQSPGGVVQGTDGNFYGTTSGGGLGYGTVFKITSAGELITLYSFCSQTNCTDGANPVSVVQVTNGKFYGTTSGGGTFGDGTLFDLSVGLGPFVETKPTYGEEGTKIGILKQGFSSSSVIKFGDTKATTIVLSGTTFITATVPAGALTGSLTVTTGTTTLATTKTFKVLPTIASFTPESDPVGTSVTIKGTGLEQTMMVTFDGKSATFTVISDTEVMADVPTGAATGRIAVTTKGGSATSATSFTVN